MVLEGASNNPELISVTPLNYIIYILLIHYKNSFLKNAESDRAQVHDICLYLAPSSAKSHAFNLASPEPEPGITDSENRGL